MAWISDVVDNLHRLLPLRGQPISGVVRCICSLFFMVTLISLDTFNHNGGLGFICHPETNDVDKEECFSHYSAEMSPLMRPFFFLLVTAGILVVLWSAMILYSFRHQPKIRTETDSSEKDHLCDEFWKYFRCHVRSEAVFITIILVIFCCSQKISFNKTYNCTLMSAPVKKCSDKHLWDKSTLNIFFIGWMVFDLFLCFWTLSICNKEHFIKDLLNLHTKVNETDDDSNYHRNSPMNANDGSSGCTNTRNHNEQQVARVRHKVWNIDAAQVPDGICLDLADHISTDWKKLGRWLSIPPYDIDNIDAENPKVWDKSIAMLNKWKQIRGDKATVQVLRKALENIGRKDLSEKVRDEMLAEEQLPQTEGGLVPWNTETDLPGSTVSESSLISNTIRRR